MPQYCSNDPCETEATKFYITDKGVIFYLCDTCAGAFELGQVNETKDVLSIDALDTEDFIRDWIGMAGLDKKHPVVVAYGPLGSDVWWVWLETEKDVIKTQWHGQSFATEEDADAFAQRVQGALLDLKFTVFDDWLPEMPLDKIDWELLGNQAAELAKIMEDRRKIEGDTDTVQALEGLWNMCHDLMDWKEKQTHD